MTPPDPQALEQAVEIALERIMKAMWSKDRVFKEQVSQEMDE